MKAPSTKSKLEKRSQRREYFAINLSTSLRPIARGPKTSSSLRHNKRSHARSSVNADTTRPAISARASRSVSPVATTSYFITAGPNPFLRLATCCFQDSEAPPLCLPSAWMLLLSIALVPLGLAAESLHDRLALTDLLLTAGVFP